MTLLKNDGDLLPFPKGGKVALIGKSSNNSEDLLGNYVCQHRCSEHASGG